jgi:hypothetical protein
MRTGGTAMAEDARQRRREEIGFEMIAHFRIRTRRILSLNREAAN